jgi:molybdopterin synthase sulfur carrier subunit
MAITVFIPGALRGECDGQTSIDVAVEETATLASVLDVVARQYPRFDRRVRDEQGRVRRYVNIFVGEDECRTLSEMDSSISDGSEVRVLPSVAGG